jgi:hypothetical protein
MKGPRDNGPARSLAKTLLVRSGISLASISGIYLAAGLAGWLPLELEALEWNNVRIISGLSILGCLMAAVGYGDE